MKSIHPSECVTSKNDENGLFYHFQDSAYCSPDSFGEWKHCLALPITKAHGDSHSNGVICHSSQT